MILEEQLLPDPALKPAYEKAVWVYVYRTFEGDEPDRLAERISLRFGVTSWPQLFLADPATMEIRAHTGRTKESFLAAVARVQVDKAADLSAHERLQAAEARAIALEGDPSVKRAKAHLDDEDVVVRSRALQVLAAKAPAEVAARAADLLRVPNDPFRYLVCEAIAKTADPGAVRALEALVRDPTGSLNPNVLRIRAVQALAACGDAASVEVIAPHAASGLYFNGLTGSAVDALAAIARRDPKAREAVATVLRGAYPKPPPAEDADDAQHGRAMRACIALARRVHKALGEKRPFPEVYDDEARARLAEEPE